jgi:hypothetical protein
MKNPVPSSKMLAANSVAFHRFDSARNTAVI